MRIPLLLVYGLPLVSSLALADTAQDDMSRVIAHLDLDRARPEAHASCVRDVPEAAKWMNDATVERYCVLRHGAPRQVGLFVGVRLSADLERAGNGAQSRMIDALLEARYDSEPKTLTAHRP